MEQKQIEKENMVLPEAKFSTGAIQVSIWHNPVEGSEGFKTIVLQRRYKDKDGSWKSTNNIRVNDIPKATLVLNKAYEYLVLREQDIVR